MFRLFAKALGLQLLGVQLVLMAEQSPAKSLAVWETQCDVSGIIAHVPELKHPLPNGWQPTLYPEFFEKGKVLNDAVLPPKTPGVVWSGLGLPDKAMIRTLALGRSTPEVVEITPFPGVPVPLLARLVDRPILWNGRERFARWTNDRSTPPFNPSPP